MFGTNILRKQAKHDDGLHLLVQETFATIQGEGPYAGEPAIFVRLAGCHLRCYFCDTDFESKAHTVPLEDLAIEIRDLASLNIVFRTDLVVLTGGEPMRQNILPLCAELVLRGYIVQIETAGNLWVEGLDELCENGDVVIVCSPKTAMVHEKVEEYCHDWKYLIQEGIGTLSEEDGLPCKSTQDPNLKQKLWRPERVVDNQIWVQPCEAYRVDYKPLLNIKPDEPDQAITNLAKDEVQTARNTLLAANIAMKYRYRLSLQLHKIVGLP